MEAKANTQTNGKTVSAWRNIGRAAVGTALAAAVFLAVWSPTSAGVTQAERSASEIVLGATPLAGGGEYDNRAIEANRAAADYGQWLRAAHGRAGVAAQAQPLPPQF